jgi:hypothetical protein
MPTAGFPCGIAVPPEGLDSRLDQIIAWLDANCGADGWASTPSSTRGVVNDALAVQFADVSALGSGPNSPSSQVFGIKI